MTLKLFYFCDSASKWHNSVITLVSQSALIYHTRVNIFIMFLIFHLSSRQILIPACVPQTGLSCLPPSNPDCHPESSKKYTLPGKQYKLAHRFGFVFFFPHQTAWFQNAQKVRAKANSLSVPPTTDMHIHELLNPGNQKRERGQPSIASHHIHMYMCMYTYIYIYGERERVHIANTRCTVRSALGKVCTLLWIQTFVYQGSKPVLCCSRCKAIMKRPICISPHLRCTVCGTPAL